MLLFAAWHVPIAAQTPAGGEQEVVVRARPLGDLEADWRACLSSGCAPREEIARALALIEAEVRAGDYRGGWGTARTAKRRNLRYADTLPVPVAQVVRAAARLADLNGEPEAARVGMIDTADTLRKGLNSTDERVLLARLDIGDAFVSESQVEFALNQYSRVARAAQKLGKGAIAAEARFRGAALMTWLSDGQPAYRADARTALKALAESDDPAILPYRDLARLLAINLLPSRKQAAAVDALLPGLTPTTPGQPVLAWAPRVDFRRMAPSMSASDYQQWADLGFRIGRDGRVVDVSPLRHSSHLDATWLAAVVQTFSQRRYVPVALAADSPGSSRVARITFVADSGSQTGSGLVTRASSPRIDIVDLGPIATAAP